MGPPAKGTPPPRPRCECQHDHERPQVRVCAALGQDPPQVLADDPEAKRQHDPCRERPPPPVGAERPGEADPGLRHAEADGDHDAVGPEGRADGVRHGDEDARLADRALDEVRPHDLPRGIDEGRLGQRGREPEQRPAPPKPRPADVSLRRRPGQEPEHRVDHDGARCPRQHPAEAGRHQAEPLADPPDHRRPGDRDEKRRLASPGAERPGDAEADRNLERCGGEVPDRPMALEGGDRCVDRVAEPRGLAHHRLGELLGRPVPSQLGGLGLEQAVEHPEDAERDRHPLPGEPSGSGPSGPATMPPAHRPPTTSSFASAHPVLRPGWPREMAPSALSRAVCRG